jgi:hypothetical protein
MRATTTGFVYYSSECGLKFRRELLHPRWGACGVGGDFGAIIE